MIYDLCIMINMLKFKQRHLAAYCLIFPLKHNPIFIICNPHRLWQDCRIAKYCRIAECYWKIGKVVSWTATKSFKIHT